MSSQKNPTRIVAEPSKGGAKLPAFFRIFIVLFVVLIIRFVFMLFYYNYITQFADTPYYSSYLYFGIAVVAVVSILLGVPLGYLGIHSLEGTESIAGKRKSIINPFLNMQKDENTSLSQKYGIFTLLLIGLLLYILFYLPLDILFNLIPGILEYQATSLSQSAGGDYYATNFDVFLVNAILVHCCVGFWEELYFRYFLGSLHEIETDRKTAIITTSVIFGLVHFYYIFRFPQYPLFSVLWGLAGVLMAFISITVYFKYRSLVPVVLAHAVNNILASFAVRQTILGYPLRSILLNYYIYILVAGGIIALLSMKFIRKELPEYLGFVKEQMKIKSETKWFVIVFMAIIISMLSSLFF